MSAEQPPFVLLEHATVAGIEFVRVVGWTNDESEAHTLGETMARAGCRVWLIDLLGDETGPKIERYTGPAAAVWANEQGVDLTSPGGADLATGAGR